MWLVVQVVDSYVCRTAVAEISVGATDANAHWKFLRFEAIALTEHSRHNPDVHSWDSTWRTESGVSQTDD
ncbi:MAG: hypothetical protein J2P17_34060 [Mycobacterium sp.]|nr:hypothetical protein [Mycobacterium sp.]